MEIATRPPIVLTAEDRAAFAAERYAPRTTVDQAAFRALLKCHREARRWSQERLADEAEMDHSLVSRLESGQRGVTRDAIGKLADALEITGATRDVLYWAAAFVPPSMMGTYPLDDLAFKLFRLLRDPTRPPARLVALLEAALDLWAHPR